jgi:hypothetical protein
MRTDARAELVAQHVGTPLFGPIVRELMNLDDLGVELTEDVVARIVERAADREARAQEPKPAKVMGEYRPRRVTGRFTELRTDGPVVYYARIGNRVKIGTTTALAARMATINPEELLAVESGGVDLERRRHGQFADLRTHGEWFTLEGPLTAHIEAVREAS